MTHLPPATQGRTLQDVYRERIFEANWALNCALKARVAQNLHNYARYLFQRSTLIPNPCTYTPHTAP